MKQLKRLFGGLEIGWGRLILFAVICGVYTGVMAMLPEAIRDSSDGADLFGKMRGKGITYMTREICDELVENRTDYSALVERRKEMEKADELNKLLRQGTR